eukprot:TRINITY_DN2223_c0_g1_i2.p1 TRINITY_DN2223_c0_g1~~TRINITY_DN2223_c0_g1_i2.p1  ORF type:complete len:366 (-),score=75.93 TRINITY_DN2223_c0_g1_i2:1011-2036(-)
MTTTNDDIREEMETKSAEDGDELMKKIEVTLLPYELKIGRIQREFLESLTNQLLKIVFFFDRSNGSRRFFSLTITNEEVSLIGSEESLLELGDHVTIDPTSWRALELRSSSKSNSSDGDGVNARLIQSVTSVLAQQQISIFYISTFDSDVVLVPYQSVDQATELLERVSLSTTTASDTANGSPNDSESAEEAATTKKMHLTISSESLCIRYVPSKAIDSTFTLSLLKLLFYPRSDDGRTICITETDHGLTLILDQTSRNLIDSSTCESIDENWRCISFCDSIDQANALPGLVASLCAPLVHLNTRTLAISSYSTDYALVKDARLPEAIEFLSKRFNVLSEE